ncbi:hypothetical protein BLA60_24685 [Actinophytocola xinjiangensis]|uniref:DNA-binding SARP family transcriptional activator n=1 Tax=Actinophytocola xinjiangensis TaxID=485602 RepID=A0A7Z0WLZ7_9PSEU|nr:BTAD domain-containing putative transcriptional regulator [Actinophytocola xinjiangensis]OLF08068.1 hypothetical protein BLA60_24685 [Actinophytocola xinjiangensis]
MEFQILGALRLRATGPAVEPAGHLQRVMLAVLLARANEPVAVDVLVDAMWSGRPDPRSGQRLQVHVHKLRRVLDDPARLSFGPSGYRLEVRPGELDLARFTDLVERGAAEDEPSRRADLLREALDLWHGQPFDGLDTPVLADETQRLVERRLTALELLHEAELTAGRHASIVPELAGLVREHPLRERFTWLLMSALYRDGRQAEALDAYRSTRDTLVEELGLDPGPELRALESRILSGEPDTPAPPAAPAPAVAPVPAQLPANVTGFVGRQAELSQLDDLLGDTDTTTGADAPPVVVVAGTAGVGKTTLAVLWSHRRRDRFPDGQLYVDLRGYGPAEPAAPEDVLAGFLRALGLDGSAVPGELDERSARFRTLVDGRRMVMVLDNARTVEQVRPLLPGSATVTVLVTSRDALAGLVARDGAQRLGLGRLPRAESVDLLNRLVGENDRSQVDELVRLCARLPLALRVAGELVRSRRGDGMASLVAELVDEQHRLDVFDSDDDPHTAVRAVFSWSYQNLTDVTARLFRLCGAHPGRDVDAYALAAMAGTDPRTARRGLAALARAHLIEQTHDGRFRMHDLLRTYAAELAAADTDDADAGIDRLRAYYLHTATLATDQVSPHLGAPHLIEPGTVAAPTFTGYDDALHWLDTEISNVVATADPAVAGHVTALSYALWHYLDVRGHFDEAIALNTMALRAARETGDRRAEANALRHLGSAYFRLMRTEESIAHSEQAMLLYRELGDASGEGAALNNTAAALFDVNRFREVVPLCERAVELLRRDGVRSRLASGLSNLGSVYRTVGDYAAAARYLHEAVELSDEDEDRHRLIYPLHELAFLANDTGQPLEAIEYAQRALDLAHQTGNRTIEGEATYNLGRIHRQLGEHDLAVRCQHDALRVAEVTDDQILRLQVLVVLGQLHLDVGETDAALERHREALAIPIDRPLEKAQAEEGIGDVHAALGEHDRAAVHWRRALTTYLDLGVPGAENVRPKLSALS